MVPKRQQIYAKDVATATDSGILFGNLVNSWPQIIYYGFSAVQSAEYVMNHAVPKIAS